jgi:V-type H+-transporting ATPase subunit d
MSLEFTIWNMENGFVDGLIRGWRSTFLTDLEYSNLKEGGRRSGSDGKSKEDFEDLRLTLQETDYGNFLAAEVMHLSLHGPEPVPGILLVVIVQPMLDPKLIGARATAKWVKEFKYFRATATGQLAQFMDFITYEYMIDNILDLIKAATSTQTLDMEAVVENCHPLGMLEPSVMKSILAYDDLGT